MSKKDEKNAPANAAFPSKEEFVKAGYRAENYEKAKADWEAELAAKSAQASSSSAAPADSRTADAPELSYPAKPKKGTPAYAQVNQLYQNWKEQKKEFCKDPKCFYPLEVKRDSATNEPITRETAQGLMQVGECTWDPRHMGGEQLFKKPVRTLEQPAEDL